MSDMSMSSMDDSVSSYDESEKTADTKTKIIKMIFFILCLLLLIEVAVYKMILPSLGRPKVTFTGGTTLSVNELYALIGPLADANWFSFDQKKAESLIASDPAIDYVQVTKHFPDRVAITVEERVPVAMTFLNDGGNCIPLQIDKNGVLFPVKTERADADSVPIVSGLPLEHMTAGMRIPVKYRTLIDQIAQIRALPQKYFAAISEICVVPKEYGNYELVLIPSHSHTKVLTDRALNEDALQYMMVVLDVVNSIQPGVSEIDLRYGSVSYRTR